MKGDFEARVISNRKLAPDVSDIGLQMPDESRGIAPAPGQFAHISCGQFLRRPISIAGFDPDEMRLRIIVRSVGRGTEAISRAAPGEAVRALMPLGNPYPFGPGEFRRVWLAAGGIGAAPLLFAAKYLARAKKGGSEKYEITSFVGFRDSDSAFGLEEFEEYGKTFPSIGGLVTEKISQSLETDRPDAVFACGPEPMIRALAKICAAHGVKAYASLEARMGCGIGACLVCNCLIKQGGGEYGKYKRVCRDGPVFDLSEAEFR
ncbi:MAG: dihydroorotate dehydrogenase electron transfer subunit [Synergistaceae bacterium]|jgi:dihydroorotate dehydrogenase electron transfer subunit|nr:dihydroorotate dehydrogenase electron transfer subunit [Synergistaceae bacterium]